MEIRLYKNEKHLLEYSTLRCATRAPRRAAELPRVYFSSSSRCFKGCFMKLARILIHPYRENRRSKRNDTQKSCWQNNRHRGADFNVTTFRRLSNYEILRWIGFVIPDLLLPFCRAIYVFRIVTDSNYEDKNLFHCEGWLKKINKWYAQRR